MLQEFITLYRDEIIRRNHQAVSRQNGHEGHSAVH
jgi:hypothetical protein